MLSEQQVSEIQSLLTTARYFISSSGKKEARDFLAIKNNIILNELRREVHILQILLRHPEQFEKRFEERCKARTADKFHIMKFSIARDSLTNRLYHNIAQKIFEKNAAKILFPGVRAVFKPVMSDLIPQNLSRTQRRDHFKNPDVVIETHPVETISFEELEHYVITDTVALDVRTINDFYLGMHQQLYHQLKRHHPDLAQALYSHNASLKTLEEHILFMDNRGKTPKEAIQELIKGLVLGGSMLTGTSEAGDAAKAAYFNFFDYFKQLPHDLQKELNALKGEKTLDSICAWLRRGECVETAAAELTSLVQKNQDNKQLNTSVFASEEQIELLRNKYKTESLITTKDAEQNSIIPARLLEESIAHIKIEYIGELILLLLNFPMELYTPLLARIDLLHASSLRLELLKVLKTGLFHSTQKIEIIKSIASLYGLREGLIFAIEANNFLAVQVLLAPLSATGKFNLVNAIPFLLHSVANNPEILQFLLELYPENERLAAVKVLNGQYMAVLHYAAVHYESLKTVLDLYPVDEVRTALVAVNFFGESPLHYAAQNPEGLKLIFSYYDAWERMALVQFKDIYFKRVVDYAASNPKSLEVIFEGLQQVERCIVSEAYDLILLHNTAHYSQSVEVVLKLYSEQDREGIVQFQNNEGYNLFEYVKESPESLRVIFNLLPENKRFTVFKKNKETLSHIVMDEAFRKLVFADSPCFELIHLYCQVLTVLNAYTLPCVLANVARFFSQYVEFRGQVQQMMDHLEQCTSVEEIKILLLDFLSLNNKEPTIPQMRLLNALLPDNKTEDYCQKMNHLSLCWQSELPKELTFVN